MADVDMTDAPSGSVAPTKKAVGKTKGGAEGGADGKKRFEVKKASTTKTILSEKSTNELTVVCCGALGLGYRRRQLRHLQKPYHGSL